VLPKSTKIAKVAMCYMKSKIKSRRVFMLAQFKLFDSKGNVIYTGGQNLIAKVCWKETEVPENETMIGLRCAGF